MRAVRTGARRPSVPSSCGPCGDRIKPPITRRPRWALRRETVCRTDFHVMEATGTAAIRACNPLEGVCSVAISQCRISRRPIERCLELGWRAFPDKKAPLAVGNSYIPEEAIRDRCSPTGPPQDRCLISAPGTGSLAPLISAWLSIACGSPDGHYNPTFTRQSHKSQT